MRWDRLTMPFRQKLEPIFLHDLFKRGRSDGRGVSICGALNAPPCKPLHIQCTFCCSPCPKQTLSLTGRLPTHPAHSKSRTVPNPSLIFHQETFGYVNLTDIEALLFGLSNISNLEDSIFAESLTTVPTWDVAPEHQGPLLARVPSLY